VLAKVRKNNKNIRHWYQQLERIGNNKVVAKALKEDINKAVKYNNKNMKLLHDWLNKNEI
jgi:monoamine oxidase